MEGRARTLPAPVFIDLTGRARVRRIATAGAAFAALIVFGNSLANGFVLDDRGVVLDNPLVTSPLTAWRAFGLPYWPETIGGGQYRPLGILSFALASIAPISNVLFPSGVCWPSVRCTSRASARVSPPALSPNAFS